MGELTPQRIISAVLVNVAAENGSDVGTLQIAEDILRALRVGGFEVREVAHG